MKSNKAVLLYSLCVFLLLCITGCSDEPEDDYSIGEITIYNIPAVLTVNGNGSVSAPVFKVYVNASKTQSENDPPTAKGLALISTGTLENGKYTITIPLQKPNPKSEDDPNYPTGSWSGTATWFSVMLSPQNTAADGVDAVWIKGGDNLNKGKKSLNWENDSLINFRDSLLSGMGLPAKALALYNDIVCKDDDIISGP